jgi:hypothetical protein
MILVFFIIATTPLSQEWPTTMKAGVQVYVSLLNDSVSELVLEISTYCQCITHIAELPAEEQQHQYLLVHIGILPEYKVKYEVCTFLLLKQRKREKWNGTNSALNPKPL